MLFVPMWHIELNCSQLEVVNVRAWSSSCKVQNRSNKFLLCIISIHYAVCETGLHGEAHKLVKETWCYESLFQESQMGQTDTDPTM